MTDLEMKVEALIRCVPKDVFECAMNKVAEGFNVAECPLDAVIRETLREIGMPSHLLGFNYTVSAVEKLYKNQNPFRSVAKSVYTPIAEEYGNTPSGVERAIRHGIEVAWGRYGSEVREEYFNSIIDPCKANPTSTEFLFGLVDIVRQKMR